MRQPWRLILFIIIFIVILSGIAAVAVLGCGCEESKAVKVQKH
jgi:hypothetical protein